MRSIDGEVVPKKPLQFIPQNEPFVPDLCRGRFFVVG